MLICRRHQAIFLMALANFFVLPSAAWAEEAEEIPVLIAVQTGADGKPLPTPATVDAIVKLLAEESGQNLVVRSYPWRRALLMAERGEGLLYGAAVTPERALAFYFTKPLYIVNQWLIVSAARPFKFQQWEDLRGKVISIQSGAKFSGEFEARRNKLFTVEENSETHLSRFKMLALARVDAVLMDSYRSASRFETRLNCVYAEACKMAVLEKAVGTEPLLISVAKSGQFSRMVPVLNDAIDRLVKSQAIHKFLEKLAAGSGC